MTTTETKEKYAEDLAKFNQLFANRYTDKDEEYVEMTQNRLYNPPVVDNWPQNNYHRPNRPAQFSNYHRQQRNYSQERRHSRFDNNGHQPYRNYSYDNRYRRERSRSPPYQRRQ